MDAGDVPDILALQLCKAFRSFPLSLCPSLFRSPRLPRWRPITIVSLSSFIFYCYCRSLTKPPVLLRDRTLLLVNPSLFSTCYF